MLKGNYLSSIDHNQNKLIQRENNCNSISLCWSCILLTVHWELSSFCKVSDYPITISPAFRQTSRIQPFTEILCCNKEMLKFWEQKYSMFVVLVELIHRKVARPEIWEAPSSLGSPEMGEIVIWCSGIKFHFVSL